MSFLIKHSDNSVTGVTEGAEHGRKLSFTNVIAAMYKGRKIFESAAGPVMAEFVYDANADDWKLRMYASSTDDILDFPDAIKPVPLAESIARFEEAMSEIQEHGR